MSQGHNHLNHATWECKYHVVFTPKYRKKVLFGQIRCPSSIWHSLRRASSWNTVPRCRMACNETTLQFSMPSSYSRGARGDLHIRL
jgi:putative transposase